MWNVRVTVADCAVFVHRLSLADSCIIYLYEFNIGIVRTGGVRYLNSILVMRNKLYSSTKLNQNGSEFHSTSYSMGTGFFSPKVKRSAREVDHSPSSSSEVKNEWSYTSTSSCTFLACKRNALHLTTPY